MREVIAIPGERLCYRVSSDMSNRMPYRVDLEENSGFGQCDCKNFKIVRAGRLAAGERAVERVLCKHLISAHVKHSLDAIRRNGS